MKTLASFALVCAIGCGSSSNPPAFTDAPTHADAPRDSKVFLDSAAPTLKVKNFDAWCSVTVNGGTASAAEVQMMTITQAGMITLTATPNPADGTEFELGPTPWHDTPNDTGTGDSGTIVGTISTVMVPVTTTASKCVWACCPFSADGTGCEVASIHDQCP